MNAELTGVELTRDDAGDASDPGRRAHSLIDVLMPATPPEPKNARVVRLFDYEAGAAPPPVAPRREPSAREAAKAARNLSLSVAAGLS